MASTQPQSTHPASAVNDVSRTISAAPNHGPDTSYNRRLRSYVSLTQSVAREAARRIVSLQEKALAVVCPQCGARAFEWCSETKPLHETRLRFGQVEANPLQLSSRPSGGALAAAFFSGLARCKSTRKQQGGKVCPTALPPRGEPRRDFCASSRPSVR